jgi:peroxiredoxin Q/BCP
MLQVGDPAPELGLESDTGGTLHLAALRGTRLVLFFYPRDDTPG